MAVFDLIYPETKEHMNGFDLVVVFARYRTPRLWNLYLRKRILLIDNSSQAGLSHLSL